MAMFKIKLLILGSLKRPVDFAYLDRWRTKIFSFEPRASVGKLPDMLDPELGYSDRELRQLINSPWCK
jgi:hypothetical protein